MSSGRLSGRVERHDPLPQVTVKRRNESAAESLRYKQAATTRVTGAAVRQLTAQLSPLDYCVLDTLNTVRIATGAQLRRIYWADSDTGRRLARHHLAKLTKLRLL